MSFAGGIRPLARRHALVTGGGCGIGAAVALVNAAVGWPCLPSSASITGQAITIAGGEVM